MNTHSLETAHGELYGRPAELTAVAPGRAEIIGNHTDYNHGFTISANIEHELRVCASPRDDQTVRIHSDAFGSAPVEFQINSAADLYQQKSDPNSTSAWANYCKGVLWSYLKADHQLGGFDASLVSSIPSGGGMSSSAAYETAISRIVAQLSGIDISDEAQVGLCLEAENDYVGVPCGTLDQATIGLSKQWLVMDHQPRGERLFSYENIEQDIALRGLRFVIGYDPHSKHSLVDGKYAARRQACADSLPVFSRVLERNVSSLRDVSPEEFDNIRNDLTRDLPDTAIDYVEHVVRENDRVLTAIDQLKSGDFDGFGEHMTLSGRSSLDLYRLDEDTPELRDTYEFVSARARALGVLGVRNMGGGFNATTIALIHENASDNYTTTLATRYERTFGRPYQFATFTPTPAARIV